MKLTILRLPRAVMVPTIHQAVDYFASPWWNIERVGDGHYVVSRDGDESQNVLAVPAFHVEHGAVWVEAESVVEATAATAGAGEGSGDELAIAPTTAPVTSTTDSAPTRRRRKVA